MGRHRITTCYLDLPEHRRTESEGSKQRGQGAWSFMKKDSHLSTNSKVRLLGIKLGIGRVCAVGIITTFWENVANDRACQYGDISSIDPLVAESWVDWSGEPGRLYAILVELGFVDLDDNGTAWVHDWWDYAGEYLTMRDDKRDEMRSKREAQKKAKAPRKSGNKMLPEHSDHVSGTHLRSDISGSSNSRRDLVRGKDQGEAPVLASQPEQPPPLASPPPPIVQDRDPPEQNQAACERSREAEASPANSASQALARIEEPSAPQVYEAAPPIEAAAPGGLTTQDVLQAMSQIGNLRGGTCPNSRTTRLVRELVRATAVTREHLGDALVDAQNWSRGNGQSHIEPLTFAKCLRSVLTREAQQTDNPEPTIAAPGVARPPQGRLQTRNFRREVLEENLEQSLHNRQFCNDYESKIKRGQRAKEEV